MKAEGREKLVRAARRTVAATSPLTTKFDRDLLRLEAILREEPADLAAKLRRLRAPDREDGKA